MPVGHEDRAGTLVTKPKQTTDYVNIEHTDLRYWLKSCVGVRVRVTEGRLSNTEIFPMLKNSEMLQVYNYISRTKA